MVSCSLDIKLWIIGQKPPQLQVFLTIFRKEHYATREARRWYSLAILVELSLIQNYFTLNVCLFTKLSLFFHTSSAPFATPININIE